MEHILLHLHETIASNASRIYRDKDSARDQENQRHHGTEDGLVTILLVRVVLITHS